MHSDSKVSHKLQLKPKQVYKRKLNFRAVLCSCNAFYLFVILFVSTSEAFTLLELFEIIHPNKIDFVQYTSVKQRCS